MSTDGTLHLDRSAQGTDGYTMSKAPYTGSTTNAAGVATILELFFALRHDMPGRYIHSFVLVALDEGRGVKEYAERAGVSTSVMSRHLLDIGVRNRRFEEGLGLVEYRPNPFELRKHEYRLTPKGRALWHKIERIWATGRAY